MDKLISDHPNAIIRTYSMRILRTLTSSLSKRQRKPPIEVGISKKSMVGFEGL